MASSSCDNDEDDVIVIAITSSDQIGAEIAGQECFISASQIQTWNLSSILSSPVVKVQAHRSRLISQSSFFHGMLNWSFSESRLDQISIEWDLEAFLNVVKCIYGCRIDISCENFLASYEAALYFGVKILLENCKTWFSDAASSAMSPQIPLDDLISIWNFGIKHDIDFLPELCESYLAKNFMWAVSCKSFVDVPYSLLLGCIKHQHLTVESEMHLSDALLIWLDANKGDSEGLSTSDNNYSSILEQVLRNAHCCIGLSHPCKIDRKPSSELDLQSSKTKLKNLSSSESNILGVEQIHPSLLPLWFTAGKRRSCHLSKLADESITSVLRLIKIPPIGSIIFLKDGDLNDTRIRLTEYSKIMNLSSCPQITSAMLLLSLLPSVYHKDSELRKSIKQLLIKLESTDRFLSQALLGVLPMLSFKAVEEVNISKCRRLHLQASIECFSMSFPSLKILKAAHLLDFDIKDFRLLVWKCPAIHEVDLTLDTSPVISEQISNSYLVIGDSPVDVLYFRISRPMMSNITKLTLEGRSELSDSDLLFITKFCIYLQHVNVNGCTALTDVGLSALIDRRVRLQSILVCHTSFGLNSVLALCSRSHHKKDSSAHSSESMSLNLLTLHIGGCKFVDESSLFELLSRTQMLKSLCLRDTHLTDRALYSLACSSLEMLDVSNTMVSGAAVAHVVNGNHALKCLRVSGCRNLGQRDSNTANGEIPTFNYPGQLEMALRKTFRLEEISLGWGFSHLSIEALKPSITLLREITVSLGVSLGEGALTQLPTACPCLESIVLHFQVISDDIIINIMETLRNLRVLALCYCFGDISISGFKFSRPNLRKLQLERVTPWMTNKDLVVLTQSFPNLVELSLLGCPHLDSDSQQIISHGWPGLVSIHLEECGEVTANGVSSLLECVALEDLLLRHNGPGIQSGFIRDAASQMPLLRLVSLDFCDASEGCFNVPPDDEKCHLRAVKLARCKSMECGLTLQFLEPRRKPVHDETLVVEWTSKNVIRKVVKERL